MEHTREAIPGMPFQHRATQPLRKYHLALTAILAFCYILCKSLGSDAGAIAFFLLLSLNVIFSGVAQITCAMFFFTPLYLYVTVGTFPIYNVILLVLFLKRCFLERTKIPVYPVLAILLLAVIELSGMLVSGGVFSLNQAKFFLIILVTAMQLYHPPEGYDNRRGAKYLVCGTALFAVFYISENFNSVLSSSTRTGGLGDLDPNTYAMYNLFALSVILLFLLNRMLNKREAVLYCLIAGVLMLAGLMTLSKTFVLCTCLMFVLYCLASRRKAGVLIITSLLMGLIVLLIQYNGFMNGVYKTIVSRFTASSMMSGLTTGRSDIYTEFLAALCRNPLICFTGSGMYSYLQILGIEIRPHNCIIEMICAWGIFGLGAVIYMYMKGKDSYKKRIQYQGRVPLAGMIPLITLIVFMQSLTLMFEEATYAYLCMAIMVMYNPTCAQNRPRWNTGDETNEKNALCDMVNGHRRGGTEPRQSAHDACRR